MVSYIRVLHDGSNLIADEVKTRCANLGIKLDYASIYHPQTNGQVKNEPMALL